jgi:hypothetical protein
VSNKDDRELEFDDGWITATPLTQRLSQRGFGVGAWRNHKTNKYEFWLTHNNKTVFETEDINHLNNYLKLLIEKES